MPRRVAGVAVGLTIAADFGFARWEDPMPFGVGAFVMFGLGSWPSGRLGDLWGRRMMMIVFFFGIGASSLLASVAQGPWLSMCIAAAVPCLPREQPAPLAVPS